MRHQGRMTPAGVRRKLLLDLHAGRQLALEPARLCPRERHLAPVPGWLPVIGSLPE